MAGGIFTKTNEVLPGAYINTKAAQKSILGSNGVSGVVFAIETGLGWGKDGVVEVTAKSDFLSLFGLPITDAKLTGLRQILANASKAYVYNVNGGTSATATSAVLPWKFTAKYGGVGGNGINVTVQADVATTGAYSVVTTFGSVVVDKQTVKKASELKANDFTTPAVTSEAKADDGAALLGAIVTPVSVDFTGGANATVPDMYSLQEAIDAYEYNTLVAADAGETANVHALIAAAAQRLREEQGREAQAVIPAKAGVQADNEGIIVVGNTVKMTDGTTLTQSQFAGFVAGITASALDNQSLTYAKIEGATDAVPRFTDDQAISEIQQGHLIARATRGFVRIEVDCNSLISYDDDKSADFSKNRVIRVLDTFRNWVRMTWEDNFVGQVTNNAQGRDLLKATIANYLTEALSRGAIQNFAVEDIEVTAGPTKDSVIVNVAVTPTDAMEKLYMSISVN
ncbi:phage tail sheath subtilisin-like domain-containing protein [Lactococcus lactis]|uniref:phage tail sheath subtilisin-like domain-containing protein n=2 Tax=Lactococcus lactis TaxID=1358 RepID=UPI0028907593|nr:phage tail sheath subtilisin-like domain-containing protein [Lactococcus lactis]MDT2889421.1 phage tail sheath subtilisin-like domain-containing protein [Lactococcus lactis]